MEPSNRRISSSPEPNGQATGDESSKTTYCRFGSASWCILPSPYPKAHNQCIPQTFDPLSLFLRNQNCKRWVSEASCHRYDFWYVFGTDLTFSKLFILFSLGIDHDPLCSLCSHDLCLFHFSHVSFFTRSYGQEKSLSYYDLFDFGVLLYRRILTLILFYFLHNPTTPILPVYVDQRRPHLEKDTTRVRRMIIRQIPTVPRRTLLAPD